jgi:tripartite ATP-independent transporter DctM subunit
MGVVHPGWLSLGIFVALMGFLALGVPIVFTAGAIAVALCLWFFGEPGLMLVASRSYSFLDSYVLVAVPFFVFMASVLERSGIARDLYDAAKLWTGRMPGGAGLVTVVVGVIIGAMIGVAGGEIVLMGLVALPQLLRLGYDRRMSIGLVCATGALGSMIPPALQLVFFGMAANVPVGDLFTASFIPGLVLAGLFAGYVLLRCRLDPAMGPPPPGREQALSVVAKLRGLSGVVAPVVVLLLTLGSIYFGIASVTESAAVGAAGTLLAVWWRGELSFALVRDALITTMAACGMVIWLVLGTNALVGVYNLLGGIEFMKSQLSGLPFPPLVVVLLMVGVWVALGFFMDWIAILLLTAPIFVPTIVALGYDPLWFGVVFNLAMQLAYLTPPFAPACFYLKSVAPPDVSMDEIFAAMWPFIGLQLLALALLIAFPGLATWLPSVIG